MLPMLTVLALSLASLLRIVFQNWRNYDKMTIPQMKTWYRGEGTFKPKMLNPKTYVNKDCSWYRIFVFSTYRVTSSSALR